jgi:hypothetical protein
MKRMRLFPFLFALHPIVITYVQIDKTFSPVSVIIASLCLLTSTFVLYVALMRFFDKDRVAMALSVMWVWAFSYSSFRSLAGPYVPYDWGERLLIPAWSGVFALACLVTLNKRQVSHAFSQYFTALGILLIMIALWPPSRDTREDFRPSSVIDLSSSATRPGLPLDSLPDIYFVLLDTYPSSSALKEDKIDVRQ